MDAYCIVHNIADLGDNESEEMIQYHNSIIQEYIQDCYKIISKESYTSLIDSFINHTEKINVLIFWMSRIFTYLDRFFTNAKGKPSLAKNAINLYKSYFFNPLENDIYKEFNILIEEDRKGNSE